MRKEDVRRIYDGSIFQHKADEYAEKQRQKARAKREKQAEKEKANEARKQQVENDGGRSRQDSGGWEGNWIYYPFSTLRHLETRAIQSLYILVRTIQQYSIQPDFVSFPQPSKIRPRLLTCPRPPDHLPNLFTLHLSWIPIRITDRNLRCLLHILLLHSKLLQSPLYP